ncbi:pheromone autoinducer 2 transporter [Salmonella enterica subsp. enterica serovar Choleraesuis]|nr:pheromone autoinducer 2 transporter [Salmonella enterica subsp. enterica serovar Choleraesuis]
MSQPIITRSGIKLFIMLASLVIILAGIKIAADIIVPFILALFLAVILNPLVTLLIRLRMPRIIAVSLIITIIVLLMLLLLAYLGNVLNELTRTLPQYRGALSVPLTRLEPWLQRAGIDVAVNDLLRYIDPGAVMSLVTRLLSQLSNAMTSVFLLLLTVVFMLLEVPQLPGKLRPLMNRPGESMAAIGRAVSSVSHYLVLKTVVSLATGIIIWAWLSWLDIRFAFVWGLAAFALNYIPNIGSVLAAIPPLAQVMLFGTAQDTLWVLIGYLTINMVVGNMIEPRLMGRGLGLSTLIVFLSLIFWGWLLGPVGMLLSVPLTIAVKITLEQSSSGARVAQLLGDNNAV